MILYAESSAVLAWLLDEPCGRQAAAAMDAAELVATSELTGVECARAIVRAASLGAITRQRALALVDDLSAWEAGCDRVALSDRVLDRARTPFPVEPLRSLDALHVASAALLHQSVGAVTVLSYDDRVRANARALGMALLPASGDG
jgi:hypothetical protein